MGGGQELDFSELFQEGCLLVSTQEISVLLKQDLKECNIGIESRSLCNVA